MLYKKMLGGLALAVFLASLASTAFADTTWFNTVVPKIGGVRHTFATMKLYDNQQYAEFYQLTVGGNKTLIFWASEANTGYAITGQKSGTTGSYIQLPYTPSGPPGVPTVPAGADVWGNIKTRLTEVVDVQVSGVFDSN